MGVKLHEIIIQKKISLQDLEGKIIAVDAPNIIMSLFNFSRKNPDGSYAGLIIDRTQRPISHLYGLLYRLNFYYSKKIFPIFCFDGKDSELKKRITKDQLKDYNFTKAWYKKAINSGKRTVARQIALSKEYMWQNIIDESKQLLGALGVPYIESPASAESQCAYLVKKGIVHYSNSQDYDSLLFGAPYIVQNLSKSLRRKVQGKWTYQKITPVEIDLVKNLKQLDITIFQLVDLSLVIGIDYFPGVFGLGPKKGLKLIRQHKNIENIIAAEKENYDFSTLTSDIIREVRKIFLFPDVNESINRFHWNLPSKSRIMSLLCEEHHLNEERVSNNVDKLIISYEKCKDYFLHKKETSKSTQLTLDNLAFN